MNIRWYCGLALSRDGTLTTFVFNPDGSIKSSKKHPPITPKEPS